MLRLITVGLGLILALPCVAQGSATQGQLITVTVQAPATASRATLDLENDLKGLELKPDGSRGWSGSFAALPQMTDAQFRPRVTVYDAAGKVIPTVPQQGVVIELASSQFDSASLSAETLGQDTEFVFGDNIAADSIEVKTSPDGPALKPLLGRNSFRLPEGVDAADVNVIAARSREGHAIVFSTEQSVDVADDEEDLELQL